MVGDVFGRFAVSSTDLDVSSYLDFATSLYQAFAASREMSH